MEWPSTRASAPQPNYALRRAGALAFTALVAVGAAWWLWRRRDTDDESVDPILPPRRAASHSKPPGDAQGHEEDEEGWEELEEDEEDDGLADLEPEDREGLLAGMGVMIQQEMRRLLDKKQNAPSKFSTRDQRNLDRVSQEYLDLQAARRRYGIAETDDADTNGVAWDADDLDGFGDDYFGDDVAGWGGEPFEEDEEFAGDGGWETDSGDDDAPPKGSSRHARR